MKSFYTFLILSILIISKAYSQDEDVLRPHGSGKVIKSKSSANSINTIFGSMPIIVGVEAGLNYNMFSQTMNGLQKDSRFYVFEKGSGTTMFFGIFVDFNLTENSGIQLKVAFDQKDFNNTKDAIRDAIRPNSSVVDASVTGNFTTGISYITFTPQFRWNINPDLFLLIGPSIHFKSGNATQKFNEKINSPDDVYYNIGTPLQSKVIQSETANLDANTTRLGLEFDLGYKYKLTPNLFLVPKAGFQYMITAFGQDEKSEDDTKYYTTPPYPGTVPITATGKSLHSFQISIGIWYNL